MHGVVMHIRPTGALTFRRMPSGILHISTYPFLPPTTMSGWLRRLLMLSTGHYPETSVKEPAYYVLPPEYRVLGAYPAIFDSRRIHSTYRQGIRAFNHNAFSRLVRGRESKEVYQLHTWDYLLETQFTGCVLHENPQALELLREVVNYGCKVGKEGYAYLESVSEVKPFQLVNASARSATLVPAETMIGQPGTLYTLYRHQFASKLPSPNAPTKQGRAKRKALAPPENIPQSNDLREPTPSQVEGFVPIRAGWLARETVLDYWTDGEVFVPQAFVEQLYG